MAWTDLSFPSNSLLTSLKMTQLDENFDAVAAGNAGAPALNVNSFMVSGVASLATLNISSGGRILAPFSGGLFNANSGFNTAQVGSFGLVNATGCAMATTASTSASRAGIGGRASAALTRPAVCSSKRRLRPLLLRGCSTRIPQSGHGVFSQAMPQSPRRWVSLLSPIQRPEFT